MILADRITRYIDRCEPAIAGQHGHDRTFAVAAKLTWGFGLSVEEAWPFALEYNQRCGPPWSEYDLRRKLRQALYHPGHTKPRGHLLSENVDCVPLLEEPLLKPEPAWPKPDLITIDQVVSSGPSLYDLWEQSPMRLETAGSHAEEIIDVLFPGNPLLCCAKSNREFATCLREAWCGRLASLPLMVANPMLSVSGHTQNGRTSEHTKEATARRVYQVVEFDFAELDKSGRETLWTPLVRKWKQSGVEIADACASLILHLRNHLDHLACVCHSGGKSLHAWFRVLELSPLARRRLMSHAVSLGADRATWNRSQFVRIPDGLRNNGARQTCLYLDPKEAVQP